MKNVAFLLLFLFGILLAVFIYAKERGMRTPVDVITDQIGLTDPNAVRLNVSRPYPAPELQGIDAWINSNGETLENLLGNVVMIDFWTYSCINCIRAIPHVTEWYSKYKDKGFVVIGIHTPEFAFERIKSNVEDAVEKYGIEYPVALDNNYATWKAFDNHYWPASYFIDKEGNVRHTHFGEGDYSHSEAVIQTLLGETVNMADMPKDQDVPPIRSDQTPETYLGYDRSEFFANAVELKKDTPYTYTLDGQLSVNEWTIAGNWVVDHENIAPQDSGAVLRLRFAAKDVYLVMGSESDGSIQVFLDGVPVSSEFAGSDVTNGQMTVNEYRLYRVVSLPEFSPSSILELHVPEGIQLHAFTFGS